MKKKITLIISLFLLVVIFSGGVSSASDWPEDPVNMIVPFGTGGTTDRLARMIATFVEKELGEPFLVENRSGGGGLVGTQAYHFLNVKLVKGR